MFDHRKFCSRMLLLNEFPKAEFRFQEKQISGIMFLQYHQLWVVDTYTFSLV